MDLINSPTYLIFFQPISLTRNKNFISISYKCISLNYHIYLLSSSSSINHSNFPFYYKHFITIHNIHYHQTHIIHLYSYHQVLLLLSLSSNQNFFSAFFAGLQLHPVQSNLTFHPLPSCHLFLLLISLPISIILFLFCML